MSTNSNVVILYPDKTVKVIYVHWDGNPDFVGKVLQEYYPTYKRVKRLIELGDISVLRPNFSKPPTHSFDKPIENYTVFYGRDRGDEGCEARHYASLDEYLSTIWDSSIEYTYIYSMFTNEYGFIDVNSDDITIQSLSNYFAMKNINIEKKF